MSLLDLVGERAKGAVLGGLTASQVPG